MKCTVRVVNKKNGRNCFIYRDVTQDTLLIILQRYNKLNTDKYFIDIKNEEDK